MRLLILFFFIFTFACGTQQQPNSELHIEQQTSPTKSSIRGVSVVDSSIVWMSGAEGAVLLTTNAGKTWTILSPPDSDSLDFRDIHAFSAQEAVVISAGFPARIFKTLNAGKDWDLVYENIDSSAFMNSIHFKNKDQGIVFGDQLSGCHFILQTFNKGKTWNRIKCKNLPVALAVENGFAASGSCIASTSKGGYIIGLGGEKSRVFTSPKGNVWQARETTILGGSPSNGIYSIASSPQAIIAVGGDYTKIDSVHNVSISNDHGKNWHSGGVVNGYRSIVDYSPKLKLWLAAGSNGIDLSKDDGKSWTKVSNVEINTLQFDHHSANAWAANSKGELFHLVIN